MQQYRDIKVDGYPPLNDVVEVWIEENEMPFQAGWRDDGLGPCWHSENYEVLENKDNIRYWRPIRLDRPGTPPPSSHQGEVSNDAHEKEIIIKAFAKVEKAFEQRSWIMEGRGPYEYNDDEYKKEVTYLYEEFEAIKRDTWDNIKSKSFEYRKAIIAEYLSSQPAPPTPVDTDFEAAIEAQLERLPHFYPHTETFAEGARWAREFLAAVPDADGPWKLQRQHRDEDDDILWIINGDLHLWMDDFNYDIYPDTPQHFVNFLNRNEIKLSLPWTDSSHHIISHLEEQVKELQGRKGLRWVKATEELPDKDGEYCIAWSGGYWDAEYSVGLKSFYVSSRGTYPALKVVRWLSDSPAPEHQSEYSKGFEAGALFQLRKSESPCDKEAMEIIRGAAKLATKDIELIAYGRNDRAPEQVDTGSMISDAIKKAKAFSESIPDGEDKQLAHHAFMLGYAANVNGPKYLEMKNALQTAYDCMEWMWANMTLADGRKHLQSDAFNIPANAISIAQDALGISGKPLLGDQDFISEVDGPKQ